MKKIILALAVVTTLVSCNKAEQTTSNSTNNIVYIDSSKLLQEYQEAKDVESKYKAKSEQMGKELDAQLSKFRADVAYFEKNAQSKGMQWAQQTGAALQEREQRLAYTQQAMMQQLQEESGQEMDSLVKGVKDFIKEYGKEKGYDYILSTGEVSTVLYAKDGQDITDEIIKLLNDKYKAKQSENDDIIIEEEAIDTSSAK